MEHLAVRKFSELKLASSNVRKSSTNKEADAELKASILAQGVIMPLIISPPTKINGKCIIHAGKRRHTQVAELIKEKVFTSDVELPVYILSKDQSPEEIALIENMLREDMHPVDEFESFNRLHYKENISIDDIASRFGKTPKEIKKRLALGGVHPDIRDACRAGEMNVDDLSAFTICNDLEKQLEAFKALKKDRDLNAFYIRRYLTVKTYLETDSIVRYVGMDKYTEAGGAVSADLFHEKTYLHDTDLVDSLANEKLQASIVRNQGKWKWMEINLNYDEQRKPYKQSDPASGKKYTIKEMESMGCILSISRGGKCVINKGFVKKEDETVIETTKKNAASTKSNEPGGYSAALEQDLIAYRLSAAKADLLNHVDIGFDLVLFSICWSMFGSSSWSNPLDLRVVETFKESSKNDIAEGLGNSLMADHVDELPTDCFEKETDENECYKAFCKLSTEDKKKLVAYCASYSLKGHTRNDDDARVLDTVMDECATQIAKYWLPTRENFFGRVNLATCDEIGSKINKDKNWLEHKKFKGKAQIAEYLEYTVDEQPREESWLPEGM